MDIYFANRGAWLFNHLFFSGDSASDLDVSESDSSSTDDESSSSEGEFEFHERESLSGLSDGSAALDIPGALMADAEFRTEVQQSLERAFAEGHSVENASVELKTLRMASNVPLRRVKEAVVAAIVEKIVIVDGDPGLQRKEIGSVVGRWGELINRIGGVDAVETVSILQVTNLCLYLQGHS
jgi:translation initiation factor eIF-2B subunit epsilon